MIFIQLFQKSPPLFFQLPLAELAARGIPVSLWRGGTVVRMGFPKEVRHWEPQQGHRARAGCSGSLRNPKIPIWEWQRPPGPSNPTCDPSQGTPTELQPADPAARAQSMRKEGSRAYRIFSRPFLSGRFMLGLRSLSGSFLLTVPLSFFLVLLSFCIGFW